ncbi:MAG: hypothetical protein V1900_01450 [Candidatus Aenigmatarchaeota archaeon]
MGLGSYIRFAIGVLLSIEILRSWLFGNSIPMVAIYLSIIFLILTVAWLLFRF